MLEVLVRRACCTGRNLSQRFVLPCDAHEEMLRRQIRMRPLLLVRRKKERKKEGKERKKRRKKKKKKPSFIRPASTSKSETNLARCMLMQDAAGRNKKRKKHKACTSVCIRRVCMEWADRGNGYQVMGQANRASYLAGFVPAYCKLCAMHDLCFDFLNPFSSFFL